MTDHNLLHRRRYQLNLAKVPVTEIQGAGNHYIVTVDVGGKLFLRFKAPLTSDIRLGDLLTIFTEVLTQERPNG